MLRYMLNRVKSWSSSRHLTAKIRPGTSTPDRVWVENAAGTVAQKITSPRGSFSGHDLMTPWSKLQELYFVGYVFLNYLSSPFNLAEPGFEVTEIEPHEEILRRNTSASESGASNRLSSINDWPELARSDDARSGFPISLPQSAACPGTHLLATVPSRIARFESNNLSVRLLKPPEVMGRLSYLMAWHPRMNTDAAHIWLRRAIRETGKALSCSRRA
jgi:hypothetical protein